MQMRRYFCFVFDWRDETSEVSMVGTSVSSKLVSSILVSSSSIVRSKPVSSYVHLKLA